MKINIAIDGPTGSGKGTTSKLLAKKLGYNYLDTGALYRGVALFVSSIQKTEETVREEDLLDVELNFNSDNLVCLGEECIEEYIRNPEISQLSSKVSKLPFVRKIVTGMSQKVISEKGYILEGRDATTIIAPDAELKVYLDANIEIRAKRRLKEYQEKGLDENLDEMIAQIKERDERDMNREVAALKIAEDAIVVDNSEMTIEEQVERIYELAQGKFK